MSKADKVLDGKIVEFYGDPDYIAKNKQYLINNYNRRLIPGFTGSIFTYDIHYRLLRSRTYKNGEFNDAKGALIKKPASSRSTTSAIARGSNFCQNETSRIVECFDVYWVTETSSEYLYSYCCEETGGGNPGGGGTTGPPAPAVPIDSFTGFPTNPYDGQTATFTSPTGSITEFTFSSEMNVWLMAEVQIFRDLGNTLTIPNMPTFDPNSILTAIALPAIAEPTFFGEMILAGAAAYVATVYVYDLITWTSQHTNYDNHDYCISIWLRCYGQQCGTCYNYCRAQGYWPDYMCPGFTSETERSSN